MGNNGQSLAWQGRASAASERNVWERTVGFPPWPWKQLSLQMSSWSRERLTKDVADFQVEN